VTYDIKTSALLTNQVTSPSSKPNPNNNCQSQPSSLPLDSTDYTASLSIDKHRIMPSKRSKLKFRPLNIGPASAVQQPSSVVHPATQSRRMPSDKEIEEFKVYYHKMRDIIDRNGK
jgi:hypothetical protein